MKAATASSTSSSRLSVALICFLALLLLPANVFGFTFLPHSRSPSRLRYDVESTCPLVTKQQKQQLTSAAPHYNMDRRVELVRLRMDAVVLQGIAIGVAGLVAGIGLVAFTESQGERSKQRGGGLSESMSTRIAGKLLEDVEVSSVSDLSSLTGQLEKALMETGAAKEQDFAISEETKKKISEQADEGW